MTKQLVCANCGEAVIGKLVSSTTLDAKPGDKVCLICNSTEFKMVELPETLTCTYCKKEAKVEDILKKWTKIPFLSIKDETYYCGCRGWD